MCVCVGGGGGTSIFSCIHMTWIIFLVQNSEIQDFGGFSEKIIFWGV